ncbi:TadE/TadG family type IV pilus assembly protein [Actinoplanes sp. NBRC 103695]|uniref:TadE/TadG family type IV pilus assembly protein n=1 Tax=Actinoplanes sp. NBRC 103695 TaxID=3032202 RepID=UPI002553E464|nr:TadE/TadG family type IV pilus assembly protein [Actinoplanes sp. NBRC 103695]
MSGSARGGVVIRLRAAVSDRWRVLAATPDAGASTAEMALLTPLLIMLLLLVVLCGRLASAQIDTDAAASSGARSGSLARSQAAAVAGAERTARASLAAQGVTCQSTEVSVSTGGLRPGGAVTVTVSCRVRLSDLVLLKVPGSRVVQSSATSPIDQWIGGAP